MALILSSTIPKFFYLIELGANNEMYSCEWLLVSPPSDLVPSKQQMAAAATPRLDICQTPQQTAEKNTSH